MMQLLGQTDLLGTIIQLAFFVFIVVFSLYGAKFQMWQWLKQIETGMLELKRMAIESRQTSIETFKKFGKDEEDVATGLDRWLDYFTIMPVDLDPAGVLRRLDHLLDERRDRFQEFVFE
ncbi:MAG: DUF1512 family protein, partial [Candidatus Thorarchaeota archaeon]|nr:DUF1512 family protein [Candidatus Thorarchaeota archaeon]